MRGYRKKGKFKRRVPQFWIPTLKKSVVYSEVLNEYMRIVVTNRTINLIHEHYGFDHYLLKVLILLLCKKNSADYTTRFLKNIRIFSLSLENLLLFADSGV